MVKVNSDIEKLERHIETTRKEFKLAGSSPSSIDFMVSYLTEKLDALKRKREYIEFHIEILEVDKELESEVLNDRE